MCLCKRIDKYHVWYDPISINTRSNTLRSVPSSPGRSFFHLSLFMCLIVFTKVSYNMIFSLSGGWPDCLFDHFITECKLCYSTSVNRVNCVNSVNCVINSNSVNCVNVTNVLIFILTLRCCFFQLEKSMLRLFIWTPLKQSSLQCIIPPSPKISQYFEYIWKQYISLYKS